MTAKEKIEKAVADASAFPNPTIEYNFDEEIDESWFAGIKAVKNPMAGKNMAKVIYKYS